MLNCSILSTQKIRQYKDLRSVTLPASSGQMQVLSGHAESFVLLKEGDVLLERDNDGKERIQISGGVCYVGDNMVKIIL